MTVKLGRTATAFKALSEPQKEHALKTLEALGKVGSEAATRRAIAYCITEHRRLGGGKRKTDGQITDAINKFAVACGAPDDRQANEDNLPNYLNRSIDKPTEEIVGICALYVCQMLEEEGEKLVQLCFASQLRLIEWAGEVLRNGRNNGPPPVEKVAYNDNSAHDAAGLAVERVRQRVDEYVPGLFHDAKLRDQLIHQPDQHQVGFLCFRAALSKPREVVQSFLTILAPERSGIPFWTFAHVYDRVGGPEVRTAGGVVLTTRKTLYLVGAEGWIARDHVREPRGILQNLKPATLAVFAFPIHEVGDRHPILRGVALSTNAKDQPVIGRVALRSATVQTHEDLGDLIPVEDFPRRLLDLAARGKISVQGGKVAQSIEDLTQQQREQITSEARDILAAINNVATSEFLGATEKSTGKARTHGNLKDEIDRIFKDSGDARYVAPDGEDYQFDLHQWFNALSWK